MSKRLLQIVPYSLVFAVTSLACLAQSTAGTIEGAVSDPSGSTVAGAEVKLLQVNSGIERIDITSSRGLYNLPNLSPGNYELTITAAGFSPQKRSLIVTVGATLVVNITESVEAVTSQVEVSGVVTGVELGSSTISGTVTGGEMRELPLNGRDWTQLATLEPGVKSVGTQYGSGADTNRINRGFGNQTTIGGNRPQLNNYRVDGISINDYAGGSPGSVLGGNLGVDAIQEFAVVVSNASAEYAKTGGGVLNAVTRAGTKHFHGSAYEFVRNSTFDARNYFDGASVPPFSRNQFGGTIGTKIRTDRSFIFFDYEGLRQSLTSSNVITVPSAAARAGQLVAGAVIVDPKVVPFLAVYPLPNGRINGDTGSYTFAAKAVSSEDFYTGRFDQQLGKNDSVYVTGTSDVSDTSTPDSFNFVQAGLISRRRLIAIQESHTFSPTLLNVSRFGFSRSVGSAPISQAALNPLANDLSLSFVPGRPVGFISIAGGIARFNGGIGGIGNYADGFNSFQFYDDAIYSAGAHSLKVGFALERIQHNQISEGGSRNGGYNFGSLAKFLTNAPTSFAAQIPQPILPEDLRQVVPGFYVQDDWRVRSNLTLNLGLRYEMSTVITETAGRLATLVNYTDPTPRVGSPYFQNPTYKNFSPRFGFSYDPRKNGKTAIRGGVGLYDVLPLTYQFPLLTLNSFPFSVQGSAANLAVKTFPNGGFPLLTANTARVSYVQQKPGRSYVIQGSFNLQQEIAPGLTFSVGYIGSHGVRQPLRSQDINIVLPTLTPQGYLWPTKNAGQAGRLNPNVGQINSLIWQASSLYDALYARVIRSLGHGVRLEGSYTWSKTIDTSSNAATGAQYANSLAGPSPFLPKVFRARADFDVTHNAVINSIWQVPSKHFDTAAKRIAAEGWQVSGIFQASSGQPFSVLIGGDPLGLNNTQPFDFPDRLKGPGCGTAVDPRNVLHYIKTSCFTKPAVNTLLGNAGRNTVIGPGVTNLDASVFKSILFTHSPEGARLQLRGEVFNLMNHPNFNPPDSSNGQTQVYDVNLNPVTTSGQIQTTSTTSRQIQLSAKVIW